MNDPGLAASQIDVVSIIERTCSVFSLIGSVLVIATFSLSKAFHKPINRLVFYASFGNLMTNVATLMARTFINDVDSAGCQFQAFLVQMYASSCRGGSGRASANESQVHARRRFLDTVHGRERLSHLLLQV